MSNSEQNLQDAFAGESQANRKYLAFAKKAEVGRPRAGGEIVPRRCRSRDHPCP